MNSLVSSESELPFDYYSMPFCKPPEGVKKSLATVNPGTILTGSRILNSPYNFTVLVRHTFLNLFSLLLASSLPCRHCTISIVQVDEKTKSACQPEGFYGPLTDTEVAVSVMSQKLSNCTQPAHPVLM